MGINKRKIFSRDRDTNIACSHDRAQWTNLEGKENSGVPTWQLQRDIYRLLLGETWDENGR